MKHIILTWLYKHSKLVDDVLMYRPLAMTNKEVLSEHSLKMYCSLHGISSDDLVFIKVATKQELLKH